MDNGVPLRVVGISYLHTATYLHDLSARRGRLYADGKEAEPESVYVMG